VPRAAASQLTPGPPSTPPLAALAQRYIAAIACLKRAQYLGPLEWVTAHNLGLAHLATGQAASAFHHLSAAVNLKPDFGPRCSGARGAATRGGAWLASERLLHSRASGAPGWRGRVFQPGRLAASCPPCSNPWCSFLLLGVALARLGDPSNAAAAYERGLALAPDEPLGHLNYGAGLRRWDGGALGAAAGEGGAEGGGRGAPARPPATACPGLLCGVRSALRRAPRSQGPPAPGRPHGCAGARGGP
jgi:tetratricopeptide (TPR) repeat protein